MPKKETSDKMSKIASKAVRGEKLTKAEIKSLGGSVLSQDETKGKRIASKKKGKGTGSTGPKKRA